MLVDNRMQWSYDEWHLETAIHIPMLRVIQGNGLAKQVRRFGHVVFTEFPTMERNFDGPDAWMEVRPIVDSFLKWRQFVCQNVSQSA
jgi:hypothetical protein